MGKNLAKSGFGTLIGSRLPIIKPAMQEHHPNPAAGPQPPGQQPAHSTTAFVAAFLGWTLDAFDFFVLVFVIPVIAREFHRPISDVAYTITITLVMRPVGALIFGWMADMYGRRLPLLIDVIFYSVIEVLSGLAPSYGWFLFLRALYGIGMGGEWGVGASLAMEGVSSKRRGLMSGLLQEGYALGYLLAAAAFFFHLPPLRLARAVLRRRSARATDPVHPRPGTGIQGLGTAPAAGPGDCGRHPHQPGRLCLYGLADDDDEPDLAWHPGYVSHLPGAPAPS